jgi:ethanolamine phosphate transferase 2 subunit G
VLEMSYRHGSVVAKLLLVVANVLIPVSLFAFASGFFPYKPLLPGLAQYEDLPEYGPPPTAPFDRLIFMVVDALRRCANVVMERT